jgi:NOL1/NOP2/fmu family ribosome biogenesis protein
MGLTNQVITNTDATTLASRYPETFDLVLVDAPCSGEGMFRKYPEARGEWSLGNVLSCAKRQMEILEDALVCLKAGGELIYSTCTFSTEENEGVILSLLDKHPELSLLPLPEAVMEVTAPAVELAKSENAQAVATYTRRFYPHHAYGEGQYVARLHKGEGATPKKGKVTDHRTPLSKEESRIYDGFIRENLVADAPLPTPVMFKGRVCLLPEGLPADQRITYAYGAVAGEIVKGRFVPSHWFVNAYGRYFIRQLDYKANDPTVWTYLSGNTYPTDAPDGWCAILVEGCPLGLGKVSGGVVKNHFPKGLRPRI